MARSEAPRPLVGGNKFAEEQNAKRIEAEMCAVTIERGGLDSLGYERIATFHTFNSPTDNPADLRRGVKIYYRDRNTKEVRDVAVYRKGDNLDSIEGNGGVLPQWKIDRHGNITSNGKAVRFMDHEGSMGIHELDMLLSGTDFT